MVKAAGLSWRQLLEGGVRCGRFYFSVGPGVYSDLAKGLKRHGLTQSDTRIVVEKPFGHDLETAKALNKELAQYFDESQIYRIDHYLGKETVQNLMAVRFGNMLFEPLWNSAIYRPYTDHGSRERRCGRARRVL